MSLFANLMAVTRLDNVDISDIVLQAVKETGGDDKQAARLTKELRAAAQKAKTEFDSHRTARKTSHQRWSSTDEDYMPEERQSRSAVHDDLDSRSCTSRDSRSLTDGRGEEYPSSRQQRVRNEDGYRLRRYSRVYDDDNDDDDDDDDDGYVGNGMRKTNQNRSSHTSSPSSHRVSTQAAGHWNRSYHDSDDDDRRVIRP